MPFCAEIHAQLVVRTITPTDCLHLLVQAVSVVLRRDQDLYICSGEREEPTEARDPDTGETRSDEGRRQTRGAPLSHLRAMMSGVDPNVDELHPKNWTSRLSTYGCANSPSRPPQSPFHGVVSPFALGVFPSYLWISTGNPLLIHSQTRAR